MIHQNSLRFYKDIAYDDYEGLVLDEEEGNRLARARLTAMNEEMDGLDLSSCQGCLEEVDASSGALERAPNKTKQKNHDVVCHPVCSVRLLLVPKRCGCCAGRVSQRYSCLCFMAGASILALWTAGTIGDRRILIHRNHGERVRLLSSGALSICLSCAAYYSQLLLGPVLRGMTGWYKGVLTIAGIIVCATSVAEAFDAMYYLEQAARVTVKAMSTGRPLKLIKDEVGSNLSILIC